MAELTGILLGIGNDVAFYRHEAETAMAVSDMATFEAMQAEEEQALANLSPKEKKQVILWLETSF